MACAYLPGDVCIMIIKGEWGSIRFRFLRRTYVPGGVLWGALNEIKERYPHSAVSLPLVFAYVASSSAARASAYLSTTAQHRPRGELADQLCYPLIIVRFGRPLAFA